MKPRRTGWRASSPAAAGLLGMLLLAGCSPRPQAGSAEPAVGDAGVMRGTVEIVGSTPVNVQVVLQPPGGGGIRLAGPLVDELSRLSGAEVEIRGTLRPSGDPIVSRTMEVSGYDVISVNGRPVILGEVISVGGGNARIRTSDGVDVDLVGAPSSFAVGQKVWVQGAQSVAVQTYGTVRP